MRNLLLAGCLCALAAPTTIHAQEMQAESEEAIVAHCREVAEVMPVFGFYLQPAVGGRDLSYAFWRAFAEIENVVAIKIAAFNRYRTLDVVRAVVDAGRDDIALYTGNDDHIVADLVTPFTLMREGAPVLLRIRGGLLGHWSVWTKAAVGLLARTGGLGRQDRVLQLVRDLAQHPELLLIERHAAGP